MVHIHRNTGICLRIYYISARGLCLKPSYAYQGGIFLTVARFYDFPCHETYENPIYSAYGINLMHKTACCIQFFHMFYYS